MKLKENEIMEMNDSTINLIAHAITLILVVIIGVFLYTKGNKQQQMILDTRAAIDNIGDPVANPQERKKITDAFEAINKTLKASMDAIKSDFERVGGLLKKHEESIKYLNQKLESAKPEEEEASPSPIQETPDRRRKSK